MQTRAKAAAAKGVVPPAPIAAQTPAKPKSKTVALDKLTGEGSGVEKAFMPKTVIELVPGTVGQTLGRHTFKNCVPRPGDMIVKSVEVKVQVVGEGEREARVRKDANIFEILGGAFAGEDLSDNGKLKLLTKPFKMTDGAVFKFERTRSVVKMSLYYHTWDDHLLRFGVEVSPLSEQWVRSHVPLGKCSLRRRHRHVSQSQSTSQMRSHWNNW
jgi:hypothetical protein